MSNTQTDFPNILAGMEQGQEDTDGQHQPLHEYDVYVQEDRITFIKKPPEQEAHTYRKNQPILSHVLFMLLLLSILFIPSSTSLAAEPTVTVTIIPKSQRVTTTQNIQLAARILPPLTLTESQTIPTTGHGHQNATQARGTITFYNGLFTSQTIAVGTILTASSGVQIITDELAIMPAANPPAWGIATVSARAESAGIQGNIAAYTISQACCGAAVKAVNTTGFTGGQNERYFYTVTAQDINKLSTQLNTTLTHSMQGAFTSQLTTAEALIPPLCSEKVTPDHKPGAEATTVQVSVSETCSSVAYDRQSLQERASQLVTIAAQKQLGARYSLLGDVQYQLLHATFQNSRAILETTCSGVWVYQISPSEQLIHLIAGRSKLQAIHLLEAVPGIQRVTITGLENTAILPGDVSHIHFLVVYKEG